jgi:RHS repeat-associated protein
VPVTLQPQLNMYFIQTDHLNTPRAIFDANQQVRWKWDQQEPFGASVPDENPAGQGAFEFPGRFPGQYADRETNLAYNYFRYYDSSLGRYDQSDLIGLGDGLNTFAYVHDNPLTLSDAQGLEAKPPCGGSCTKYRVCRYEGEVCRDGSRRFEICVVVSTCPRYLYKETIDRCGPTTTIGIKG